MKKLFLTSLILSFVGFGNAQPLTGTKSIPGDYLSIADAIAALNTNGVGTDGVTFDVAAGHTEFISAGSVILNTTTSSLTSPIVFRRSGIGSNPLITGQGGGTGNDGILFIAGTDYVTFDGIDITTSSTAIEWGYALVKRNATAPFDGCHNITIRNCVISIPTSNTKSVGIYSGNHTATSATLLTVTTASDATGDINIYSNNVTGYCGIKLNGYSTGGLPLDVNFNIGVGGGNVVNIYSGSDLTRSYGIYVNEVDNSVIANNTVFGSGGTTSSGITGIGTGSGPYCNSDVYNNHVTITSSGNAEVWAFFINIGAPTGLNTVNVYNNFVENCNLAGNTTAEFRAFYISTAPQTLNVYNNQVINNTIGSSTKTGAGDFTGFYISTYSNNNNSVHSFYNNTFSGNSRIQSVAGNGLTRMIYCSQSGLTLNINNNLIENNSFPTSSSIVAGIYTINSGTNKNIHHNTIRNNSTTNGLLYGIYCQSGSTINIYKNEVYNLTGSGSATTIYGIYNFSGNALYLSNNFISDLKTPTAVGTNAITGLAIAGGIGCYVYYNSIYLNASSSSVTTFGTSGVLTNNTPTLLDFRNNIVANTSTPVGAAYTVAHRRSEIPITNFTTNSRRNCYYAGTPGPNRLIYYNGTSADQTMLNYRVRVYPGELSSFSEMPPFINITTAPYDLHLIAGASTMCESGGNTVSTIDDFDNQARYPNSGYPNDPLHPANKPDIGADEFAGIHIDRNPPLFVFTPFANTTLLTGRTLTATITDESGVPTSGSGLPVLYWKINNGSWNTSTATWISGSDYSFDLGTGVAPGNFVYYYLAAQDQANPINVGIYPGDGASTPTGNPPGCLTPSPTPLSYYILIQLEGDFTVPGSYPTLTGDGGLFQTINNNILIGDIHVTITGDLTEPGTHALNQMTTSGGNWSLNISPDAAILRSITGTYAGGLIRLNGADRVTFDGRYTGNENYFAFWNKSTAANTAVFQLISAGTGLGATDNTIRNSFIYTSSNTVNNSFGIFAGGSSVSTTGTGADNDNLSIINNYFTSSWYGIYAVGESTGKLNGILISGNLIGDEVASSYITGYGIYLKQASGTIRQNMIKNIQNATTTPPVGIYVGDGSFSFTISRNDIHSIKYTGTSTYGGHGLDIQGTVSNFVIDNNLIYDISGKGTSSLSGNAITGIRLLGSCSSMKLYYNSIHLFGNISRSTTTDKSTALYLSSGTTNLDLRNNVIINGIENTTGTAKAFAIYSDTPSTEFLPSDYNDIYAYGAEAIFGYVNSASSLTLTEWQTSTNDDFHSISVDPLFTSNTILIPQSGSPLIGVAQPLPGIIDYDFAGNTRSPSSTTMGAYEMSVSSDKTLNLTVFLEGLYAGSGSMNQAYDDMGPHFGDGIADQVTVELHNATDYATIEYTSGPVDLSTTGNIAIHTIPNSFGDSYYITIKHRNSIETTSALPVDFSGAVAGYAFDTQAKAYGSNMGLITGSVAIIYTGDENQDQIVDGTDLSDIGNLADVAASGYLPPDINGDGLVDGSDLSAAGNNADVAVGAILP